jgi:hypothetical protein
VHMNVVFRDYARQDANIFRVTDLHQQVSTSDFNIALQNVIAIFRTPNNVDGQPSNCVMSVPVVFHLPQFSHRF